MDLRGPWSTHCKSLDRMSWPSAAAWFLSSWIRLPDSLSSWKDTRRSVAWGRATHTNFGHSSTLQSMFLPPQIDWLAPGWCKSFPSLSDRRQIWYHCSLRGIDQRSDEHISRRAWPILFLKLLRNQTWKSSALSEDPYLSQFPHFA